MTDTITIMGITFLAHSRRLGHALLFLQFLPIVGLGATAIVMRGKVVLWAQHTPVCCLGMYAESFI